MRAGRRGGRWTPAADRLLVVFSDIEMGGGGPSDDFPHSDFLGALIASYNHDEFRELDVDLVFNGDTFDLLKTPFEGAYPRHITAAVAMEKMNQIALAHGAFFAALREFLAHPHAERRVHFIVGNHDAELVFPGVQAQLRQLCGDDPRVFFPGFRLAISQVLIEHGSQADRMFQVEEATPIVKFSGEEILHISWGAAALLETVIPLKGLLGFHDRIKPKQLLLDLLPELHDFLMDRFWSYWSRDFWRGYFSSSDPTKEVTWTMLKELIWRFSSQNPEVLTRDGLHQRMVATDEFALYVVGQNTSRSGRASATASSSSRAVYETYMLAQRASRCGRFPSAMWKSGCATVARRSRRSWRLKARLRRKVICPCLSSTCSMS